MADQTGSPTLEELRRTVRARERELCDLDLMLADYHTERSRLIRELHGLRARLTDAEELATCVPGPSPR